MKKILYSASNKTLNFKVLFKSGAMWGCQKNFECHFKIDKNDSYGTYVMREHEKIFFGFSHLGRWTDFITAEHSKKLEKQFQKAQEEIDRIIKKIPSKFKGVCEISILYDSNTVNVCHTLLESSQGVDLVNLTPHRLILLHKSVDGSVSRIADLMPAEVMVEASRCNSECFSICIGGQSVGIKKEYYCNTKNLPNPKLNTFYIVSKEVAFSQVNRPDLIYLEGASITHHGNYYTYTVLPWNLMSCYEESEDEI